MKQLLQNTRNGKSIVEDVPVPTPHEGQALVKTEASIVSAGTERMVVEFAEKSLVGKARSRPDLVKQVIDKGRREGWVNTAQAAFNRLDQPMAPGYSSAGTIVALGKNMQGFKIGQRVACAGGGYAVHAEYNVVPRNLLTPLPKNVDFESAAFTTLGAIALHGFRLAEPQIGENVAIIGLGLLGLLTIKLAAAAGCNVLGIDLAGVIARDRAKVVATGAVGLNIPRKIYYEKEISFINSRSYGPGRYDSSYEENGQDYPIGYIRWTEGRNFQSIVDVLSSRKLRVESLITHRFPIEKGAQAYEVITGKKKQPFLGVLLTYASKEKQETSSKIEFSLVTHNSSLSSVKLGVLGAGLYANE